MNTLIEGNAAMKFVINGRTFDTASATRKAVSRGIRHPNYDGMVGDSELRYERTLYQTGKGAFFVHHHTTEKFVKGGKPVVDDFAEEIGPEVVTDWIASQGAAIFDSDGLPLPPEA